ncbi:MAG TPA: NAD(P)H-dependent oxidoreductase subunit E [bacterium]|nr:NAD(P)H-dependent oxidoreductase subunit E [bacterium]
MPIEPNPAFSASDREAAAVERALAALGAEPRRSDMLPLLQALQEDLGWLPTGALRHLAERMHLPFPDVWGVATFYALFRFEPPRGVVVHVCDDVPCRLRGAGSLVQALEARYGAPRRFTGGAHGSAGQNAAAGGRATPVDWETVPCLGQCDHAPVAAVAGRLQRKATPERVIASAAESAGRA